jgi:hypothetical protein
MNFYSKYLKYKKKYLNLKNAQKGGSKVKEIYISKQKKETQSDIYMPIILLPFEDIEVHFPHTIINFFNNIKNHADTDIFNCKNIDEIKQILTEFYRGKGIDLSQRKNLELHYKFDIDDGEYLHIEGVQQEQILTDTNLVFCIERFFNELIAIEHDNPIIYIYN